MSSVITNADFIQSIEDAFQFISYYHPVDFINAMYKAYQREKSIPARDALAQILTNSYLAATGQRPLCQDTGICVVFLEVGMEVRWEGDKTPQELVNEGVRRAYRSTTNPLRFSVVADPAGKRNNTRDNAPAVVHMEIVRGNKVSVWVAAKGGGSENKTKFVILNPGDSVTDWVVQTVPKMGAGWCPPGILSIGIGGTPEKAMLIAKRGMMGHLDMDELLARGPANTTEEMRIELFHRINNLGIGAQGLGGLTTVFDVKVSQHPTHAVSLPVAIVPNCAATRHTEFVLDGSGPAEITAPDLSAWPQVSLSSSSSSETARPVDLNTLQKEDVKTWRMGEKLLLSGILYTARDAAHKRLDRMIQRGEPLPVDFSNKFIYYVGPVDPVGAEAVGPAGPTTATRMDHFLERLLPATAIAGMIGKAERGPEALQEIKKNSVVYLIAVGGAAFLISKAIRRARVVSFEDLGMEAIYEFEVQSMPVTVAVDAQGRSIHDSGPIQWKDRSFPLNRLMKTQETRG